MNLGWHVVTWWLLWRLSMWHIDSLWLWLSLSQFESWWQEARQLDFPQASLKKAEEALMKLLQMRELKNLRSASTGDDEMQLRNAIKEAKTEHMWEVFGENLQTMKFIVNQNASFKQPSSRPSPWRRVHSVRTTVILWPDLFEARLIDLPPTDVEQAQAWTIQVNDISIHFLQTTRLTEKHGKWWSSCSTSFNKICWYIDIF